MQRRLVRVLPSLEALSFRDSMRELYSELLEQVGTLFGMQEDRE